MFLTLKIGIVPYSRDETNLGKNQSLRNSKGGAPNRCLNLGQF